MNSLTFQFICCEITPGKTEISPPFEVCKNMILKLLVTVSLGKQTQKQKKVLRLNEKTFFQIIPRSEPNCQIGTKNLKNTDFSK